MLDFINRPVFICGHPKSGTSLLTALLDGHPYLVVYPEETLFFRRFLPAIEGKAFEDQWRLAQQMLIHIFEWNQENPPAHQKNFPDRDYSNISFDEIRRLMQAIVPKTETEPRDFLEAAILAFKDATDLEHENPKHWVEKSPYNEFYADKIINWWSKSKCIHIVRDPRDNFISYKRKHPDWTSRKFAWNWNLSTQAGLNNHEKYGADRYLLLRYEDLLLRKNFITQRITEFLSIPWDEKLLFPSRLGVLWQGNSMFEEDYNEISLNPIGRWKYLINEYDLAMIQAICKNMMYRMNYELVEEKFSTLSTHQKITLLFEKSKIILKSLLN